MDKSSKCEIISIILLIAFIITIGYGVYGIIAFRGMNQLTKLYGETPTFIDKLSLNLSSIRFMGCKTKQDVAKICSEDMSSCLNFFMQIFIFLGILIILVLIFQLIDFCILRKNSQK